MPIGSQNKSRSVAPAGVQNASKYVAERPKVNNDMVVVVPDAGFDDVLPDYDEVENDVFMPQRLLPPSSDGDLEYFGDMASGRAVHTPPYSTNLVLHLFRSTQNHIYPIQERLALGASANAPFFAMRSSPSTSSVDEYNKLTLTRRRPAMNFWETAAVSNIQPRLKLMARGNMAISLIQLEGSTSRSLSRYELWWNDDANCYRLWKRLGVDYEFQLEIGLEGWNSLDERPQTGFLVVSDTIFLQVTHVANLSFVRQDQCPVVGMQRMKGSRYSTSPCLHRNFYVLLWLVTRNLI